MAPQAQQLLSAGVEHHRAGRLAAAEAAYRRLTQIEPANADALHLLGVVTSQLGNPAAGAQYIRRAIGITPHVADFHRNLGRALLLLEQNAEAVAPLQKSVELEPGLAGGWNLLASALLKCGRIEEAIAASGYSVQINPNEAHLWTDLGNCLWEDGQRAQAIDAYERALRLNPESVEAAQNLARAMRWTGQFENAIRRYETLLAMRPHLLSAWIGLGYTQHESGNDLGAISSFREALKLSPDSPDAHTGLAHALLMMGDLKNGLTEYEWRWGTSPLCLVRPRLPQPMWDGRQLSGQRVLLHAEQGYGDTIQSVRFARDVAARGGRPILVTPPPLTRICASAEGLERCISSADAIPECDLHCPLMSLPHVLGKSLGDLPGPIPYLAPPPELVEQWRTRTQTGKFNVLVVPEGNTTHIHDQRRSVPAELFESLARLPNLAIFQIQPGTLDRIRPINVSEQIKDFADTAALMKCVDLTISVDTAAAHLAGALGCPVWLLISTVSDWRWMRGLRTSPWYPSMRIFRQQTLNDWDPVISEVLAALQSIRDS